MFGRLYFFPVRTISPQNKTYGFHRVLVKQDDGWGERATRLSKEFIILYTELKEETSPHVLSRLGHV